MGAGFHFSSLPPLAVYAHIPWCVRKCPYCDFNSYKAPCRIPESEYVDALLRDLERDLSPEPDRPAQSVYIGGGTPSLFSPDAIHRLLSGIRARMPLGEGIEITIEANPGASDLERFAGFREAGVNRLSIGIQSFDSDKLKALGRIHGGDEALRAAAAARAARFDNFNLDIMFGLPGQTAEQALSDVRAAIRFRPTHISAYQLAIEPDTPFHARPPTLPDDDAIWDMQSQLLTELSAAGYANYEVSAYARTDYECRHNLNYWQFGDYLGLGAGAHAKITDRAGITRMWKVKQPQAYLRRAGAPAGIAGTQRLSRRNAVAEFMLNALRLTKGFPSSLFQQRTGLPLTICEESLSLAEEQGLIERDGRTIRPTPDGRRFLNGLLELFV